MGFFYLFIFVCLARSKWTRWSLLFVSHCFWKCSISAVHGIHLCKLDYSSWNIDKLFPGAPTFPNTWWWSSVHFMTTTKEEKNFWSQSNNFYRFQFAELASRRNGANEPMIERQRSPRSTANNVTQTNLTLPQSLLISVIINTTELWGWKSYFCVSLVAFSWGRAAARDANLVFISLAQVLMIFFFFFSTDNLQCV